MTNPARTCATRPFDRFDIATPALTTLEDTLQRLLRCNNRFCPPAQGGLIMAQDWMLSGGAVRFGRPENLSDLPVKQGLYDPRNEHDSCGVGFVADIKGRKSHAIVRQGLSILVNLDHRGAVGA